jgi:hypothetical protein
MLDRVAIPVYELTGSGTVPGWVLAVVTTLVVAICAVAFLRGGLEGVSAAGVAVVVALMLAMTGWWAIDQLARRDLAAERRALELRLMELTARALTPGSALACLDGTGVDNLEEACEQAVFAGPQSTAAAVSYVVAQLSLLIDASSAASAGARVGRIQASLRRSLESDRFGIAAHVLATREGCTPERCRLFSVLQNGTRLRANMAERRFESYVRSHAAAWPAGGGGAPVAVTSSSAPMSSSATAVVGAPSKGSPNELYFPSASSIPPVNIMTAEPPSRERAGAEPRRAAPTTQARPPAPSGAPAARTSPMTLPPAPP